MFALLGNICRKGGSLFPFRVIAGALWRLFRALETKLDFNHLELSFADDPS